MPKLKTYIVPVTEIIAHTASIEVRARSAKDAARIAFEDKGECIDFDWNNAEIVGRKVHDLAEIKMVRR